MKIVTSGLVFLDIDAYAGCVAYAELLRLQGQDAVAFSSATMNQSISRTIRSWKAPFTTTYKDNSNNTFIIVDVSEPEYLERHVDMNRIEEVIDHHVGHEEYWEKRLGVKSNIEFIGSVCTQIYEKWIEADLFDSMSKTSARLLVSGILDNTLNFKAKVTTPRDRAAYEHLLKIAELPDDWTAQYFSECQKAILDDVENSLKNDTKIMQFKNMGNTNLTVGQLVIWDAKEVIGDYRSLIQKTLQKKSEDWLVNIVSISDGKSYFLASNKTVENWAKNILGVRFSDKIASSDRLWLRKEIFKQDQSHGAI